jgi:hypothetical protein
MLLSKPISVFANCTSRLNFIDQLNTIVVSQSRWFVASWIFTFFKMRGLFHRVKGRPSRSLPHPFGGLENCTINPYQSLTKSGSLLPRCRNPPREGTMGFQPGGKHRKKQPVRERGQGDNPWPLFFRFWGKWGEMNRTAVYVFLTFIVVAAMFIQLHW